VAGKEELRKKEADFGRIKALVVFFCSSSFSYIMTSVFIIFLLVEIMLG